MGPASFPTPWEYHFLLCFFLPQFLTGKKSPWPHGPLEPFSVDFALSPGPCQSWKSSQQRGTRNVLCGLQGAREVSCDDSGFVTDILLGHENISHLGKKAKHRLKCTFGRQNMWKGYMIYVGSQGSTFVFRTISY